MSLFPQDDKARKNLPVFRMVVGYFPKALREVTRVCVANNVRYNPDRKPADINWARGKSTDQLGSLFRHMLESAVDGAVFEPVPAEVQAACGPGFERVYVLAEAAWRALAALELQIEAEEAKVPYQPLMAYDGQSKQQCMFCRMLHGERHLMSCKTGRGGIVIGCATDVATEARPELHLEPLKRRCCQTNHTEPHAPNCGI